MKETFGTRRAVLDFVTYRRTQPRETQLDSATIAFYYIPWSTIDGLFDGIALYNQALLLDQPWLLDPIVARTVAAASASASAAGK